MASIIDGYCGLKNKSTESKWVRAPSMTFEKENYKLANRQSYDKLSYHEKLSNSNSQEFNRSISKQFNFKIPYGY